MNVRRGDVVLVLYPFVFDRGASRRPVSIVQNSRDNRRLDNTIIVQIVTNMFHVNALTHLLIPWLTPEGQQASCLHDLVGSCNNLTTAHEDRIHRVIGHLSDAITHRIGECLKASLVLR